MVTDPDHADKTEGQENEMLKVTRVLHLRAALYRI